jgi:hypothetical protein
VSEALQITGRIGYLGWFKPQGFPTTVGMQRQRLDIEPIDSHYNQCSTKFPGWGSVEMHMGDICGSTPKF